MKKRGRPRLNIDAEQVEKLAGIGCSYAEIASVVGCSVGTLEKSFSGIIAKGRESGKTRLRMLQLKAANAGNVVMLIWLGKQMLGQSDKVEQKTDIKLPPLTVQVID